MIIEAIIAIGMLVGAFLCLAGSLGNLRAADYFWRVQSVTKTGVLGACVIVVFASVAVASTGSGGLLQTFALGLLVTSVTIVSALALGAVILETRDK